jgi:hypothetical protein
LLVKGIFVTIAKVITDWSHRLTVRTPGFHPGNRSSILREITKVELLIEKTLRNGVFLLWVYTFIS